MPVLHVCGSLDPLLGNHTLAVEGIYNTPSAAVPTGLGDEEAVRASWAADAAGGQSGD